MFKGTGDCEEGLWEGFSIYLYSEEFPCSDVSMRVGKFANAYVIITH